MYEDAGDILDQRDGSLAVLILWYLFMYLQVPEQCCMFFQA
jgi:hypothetical protein